MKISSNIKKNLNKKLIFFSKKISNGKLSKIIKVAKLKNSQQFTINKFKKSIKNKLIKT